MQIGTVGKWGKITGGTLFRISGGGGTDETDLRWRVKGRLFLVTGGGGREEITFAADGRGGGLSQKKSFAQGGGSYESIRLLSLRQKELKKERLMAYTARERDAKKI